MMILKFKSPNYFIYIQFWHVSKALGFQWNVLLLSINYIIPLLLLASFITPVKWWLITASSILPLFNWYSSSLSLMRYFFSLPSLPRRLLCFRHRVIPTYVKILLFWVFLFKKGCCRCFLEKSERQRKQIWRWGRVRTTVTVVMTNVLLLFYPQLTQQALCFGIFYLDPCLSRFCGCIGCFVV